MDAPVAVKFNSYAEFGAHFRTCLARSHGVLEMFDPDFSVFPLGQADVDAALRRFLAAGGALVLAMHRTGYIERECPRFLHLLRDYGHRVECRATPPNLSQLTDSFCVGDQVHIVRRFHSEHMRGEAACDNPGACEVSLERFAAIWLESRPCLHPTVTGL